MSKYHVLFVDDEENILRAIRRAVIDEDFEALFASSGEQALKIMEETEIAVLVTDMRMPGMDGLTLLKMIKDIYPDMVKIVLSGFTQINQVLVTVNEGDIFKFIAKPWDMDEELLASVRKGLEYFQLKKERVQFKIALEQRNSAYQKVLKSMDEKMAALKKDLEFIKKLNESSFSYMLEHNESRDKIVYLREINQDYVELVPTAFAVLTTESIGGEINEEFLEWVESKKLILKCENGENEYYGNSKLIVWVMKLLLAQVLNIQLDCLVQCVLSVVETENKKKCTIRIIIKLKDDPAVKRMLMDEAFDRLVFLIGLLNEIADDGSIVIFTRELPKSAYGISVEFT
jgi:YesN/AraC family two-component response regulator